MFNKELITVTIEVLQSNDFYTGDEYIEIAKGKYELPNTFIGTMKQFKRSVMEKIKIAKNGRN